MRQPYRAIITVLSTVLTIAGIVALSRLIESALER